MKYCIKYNKYSKILDKIDEILINYRKEDTSLLDFLELYKNKRILIQVNVNFLTEDDIKRFKGIKELYPAYNFILILNLYDENVIKKIKDAELPFFLDTHINNWDMLVGMAEIGVTDVYITEDLCFELDKVKEFCKNHNIITRTFPNVAQSKWKSTPALKKFFIRPEDIEIYEQYIDVCEFFGEPDQIETYYKIYAIDKEWFGQLNEIIIGFNSEIDNKYIIPKFSVRRPNCNKQCLKGGKCRICDNIENLSKTLGDRHLAVTIDKK